MSTRSKYSSNELSPASADFWRRKNWYYYAQLSELLASLLPRRSTVLVLGSRTGELLAALKPSYGLGVEPNATLAATARQRFPDLHFISADPESAEVSRRFDYVVVPNTIGFFDDVWSFLTRTREVCGASGRLVLVYYNFLWEAALKVGESLGAKQPERNMNWLARADIANLLKLTDYCVEASGARVLFPKRIPWLAGVANRHLSKLPGLEQLCLVQYFVAAPLLPMASRPLSCSVVIPCRNERENIKGCFERTPLMGGQTELIFVDGASTDGSVEEIEHLGAHMAASSRPVRLIHQLGSKSDGQSVATVGSSSGMLRLGKGDAVRKGFDAATGDILMLLDSDLTVPPEDLPKFYEVLATGKARFANGSRLVYPMEDEAMRPLHVLGNRLFGWAFSWLLGQRIKDTLCGTKALFRTDYQGIKAKRHLFGDFDPFGDFDLLFGAANLGLSIVEVPVRYRRRAHGQSKVSTLGHGWLLLKMCVVGLRFFKLRPLLAWRFGKRRQGQRRL